MKNKIKLTAIQLFNQQGVSTVSMKQIADSIGISAGNLRYHYKDKAALLEVIYNEMYNETLNYILPKNSYITLFHFEEMMLKFDNLQERYLFFFSDVVHILQTYTTISKAYQVSNLVRFKEGRKLIDYYIESGRLKPENDYIDYDKVIYSIWMISTFWQSQKQVIVSKKHKENKGQSMQMLWNILMPYLTDKGMDEYLELKRFVHQKK
ncbi:TetR/AcrR family transcriptional regulator [Tenacibaculum halocynthiae]|uniref:TetR/AcrR family transcriptional regulator n=1 Tax=Tenacibaculum halocynthiae TaxID=1254437 RepID=UPI003D6603B0